MNDGWIEWSGGEDPYEDAIVYIKYRGKLQDKAAFHVKSLRWCHNQGDFDIIAYKLVEGS